MPQLRKSSVQIGEVLALMVYAVRPWALMLLVVYLFDIIDIIPRNKAFYPLVRYAD